MVKITRISILFLFPLLLWSVNTTDKNLSIEGYFKTGYQYTGYNNMPKNTDIAVGGGLSIEYLWFKNIEMGVTILTDQVVHKGALGGDIPFFDSQGEGYSLFAELYMNFNFNSSRLKIGRQFIDTPFIHNNDIAMIPSTYEGITLDSTLSNVLSLNALWLYKTAGGIYTETPEKFTKMNEDNGIYSIGLVYDDEENGVFTQAWAYNISENKQYLYFEYGYSWSQQNIDYNMGVQMAHQYLEEEDASIIGMESSIGFHKNSYIFSLAFNQVLNGKVDGSLGNGPFFVNNGYLGLENVEEKGNMFNLGLTYSTNNIKLNYIKSFLSYIDKHKSFADNIELNYNFVNDSEFTLTYTHIRDIVEEENDDLVQIFYTYNF